MKVLCVLIAAIVALNAQAQIELDGFPTDYSRLSGFRPSLREHGPVVANFDHDLQMEIIVLSAAVPDGERSNRILVFDALNPDVPEYVFSMPTDLDQDGYTFSHAPAVLDGDGDGNKEIAVSAWLYSLFVNDCPLDALNQCRHDGAVCVHYKSELLVFEFGNTNTQRALNSADSKLTTPSVADVTGDGLDDVVFVGPGYDGLISDGGDPGSSWSNFVTVFVWNTDAEPDQWWLAREISFGHCDDDAMLEAHTVDESTVALGDMDNDGVSEIVTLLPGATTVPAEAELHIIKLGSPDVITPYPLVGKYTIDSYSQGSALGYMGPVLGDIIQDGSLDAAFVVLDIEDDVESQELALLNGGTGQVDYVPIPVGYEFSQRSSIAIADGPTALIQPRLDVYVPIRSDEEVVMQWLRWFTAISPQFATSELGWPKAFSEAVAATSAGYSPSVVSTNSTGALEYVTRMGAGTSNFVRMLKLNNAEGSDAQIAIGNNYVGSYKYLGSSVVSDLNFDGQAELVVTADVSDQVGRIHAYALDGVEYDPSRNHWNGLLNGPKHNGLYSQPVNGSPTSQDTRWSGRITVLSGFSVPAGTTLTISPGTSVVFEAGTSLSVAGSLVANGTPSEPIVFAATSPSARWNGLTIVGGSVELDYVNLQDFKDHGIYTDAPTAVSIEHTDINCSKLKPGGIGLRCWNAPTVTQVVGNTTVHSVAPDSQCTGMYLYNCKVAFDSVMIEDCDWINSYIKKVTGSFSGCTFRDHVDYYSVFFSTPPVTTNFRCSTFENIAPTSSAWLTTIYCAKGTMPSFGAEGNTGGLGVSNVIKDFSNALLTMDGATNLPIVDSNPSGQYETNGGHNDWTQLNPGGRFFVRYNAGLTPAAYPCTEQYWVPAAQAGMFVPPNGTTTYWNYTPQQLVPWNLCGGGSGGGGSGSAIHDGPLTRDEDGTLDDGEYDVTMNEALQFEQAEDYAAAQELFRYVAENTSDTIQRWNALTHIVVCESFTLGGGSWMPELVDDMIEQQNTYESRVLGERLRASFYQNREEYDAAIETCINLLGSGLTFEDSIQVAMDLLGIQSSMGGGAGGSLDGMAATNLIPSSLRAETSEEVLQIERNLFALLSPNPEQPKESASIPVEFKLYPNHPNPFNPSTQIEFDIPEALPVTLTIFNSLGQTVATIVDKPLQVGHHTVTWDGTAGNGSEVATGLYIYQIKAGSFTDSKKMVLMR